MPIRFPDPPASVTEAITERPRRRPRLPGSAPRDMGGVTEGALPAQPVFTAGLEQARAAGAAAESVAEAPSWRVSRFDAAGRSQVAELRPEAPEAPLATGDDRFGPMIREALAVARQDSRVSEGDYEARLYRVPALALLALWLHSPGSPDLFVPIGPPPPGLERNRVYEDADFSGAVSAAADAALGTYREADSPDELGS